MYQVGEDLSDENLSEEEDNYAGSTEAPSQRPRRDDKVGGDTVCPGGSDPPEKICNIFASEN